MASSCSLGRVVDNELNLEGNNYLRESITWCLGRVKYLQEKPNIDREENYEMNRLKRFLDDLEKTKDYECPMMCMDMCNFKTYSLDVLLHHEKQCFQIETCKPQEKFIECHKCYKKFYIRNQKLKPQYALNAHLKKCNNTIEQTMRKDLINYFKTCPNESLKKYFDLINNKIPEVIPPPPLVQTPNIHLINQSPTETTISDKSSVHSSITASTCDEWVYDNNRYLVDVKNRVYDEYEQYVGKRIKEELSDEWIIDPDS